MVVIASLLGTEVLSAATTAFGDGNKKELAAAVSKLMGISESPEIVAEAIVSLQPQHSQSFASRDVDGPSSPSGPKGAGKSHGRG